MDNDEFLGHKLEDWWPASPTEGPPFPKWMRITWPPWIPWYKGFTLSITNPPPGATHWSAHFYSEEEGAFIQPPSALALDAPWNCPTNPHETTDLRILVLDIVNAITLLDAPNLGPIYSGKDYIFDCSTKILREV